VASNPGLVRFINVSTVESQSGDLVVINRNGKLVLVDDEGREKERYALTYGSRLHVHDGERVEPGREIVEWDPFTSVILSELSGKVEFHDVIEGENVREETDKVTSTSSHIVEASQNEALARDPVRGRPSGDTCCRRAPTWWCRTARGVLARPW
jgi:DNA-directed RNA polymerase subunit beta'